MTKEYKTTGWTPFYMNSDDPSGTGDHEHYFYYLNKNRDRLNVYDPDGKLYEGCQKKAIHIREVGTMLPWWYLSAFYTLLFSGRVLILFYRGRKRFYINSLNKLSLKTCYLVTIRFIKRTI